MSRPRKVIALNRKHLTKAEKMGRGMAEAETKAAADDLDNIPAWLTPDGANEYRRVIVEASALELWDNLDKGVLAIYADSFARYIEAADHLREEGATIMKDGVAVPSPWATIADRERKAVLQCSTRLGLAVTDRLRLQAPKAEKHCNKFLQFMGAASCQ